MNEYSNIEPVDLLISKYLSGNSTPEEADEFIQWLKASDENQEYFSQYKLAWLHAEHTSEQSGQNRWDKLKVRIKEKENTSLELINAIEESKERSLRLIRYAAVIIGLIGISSVLFFIAKTKTGSDTSITENVLEVPYGSKSSLTLPDGTKLWVNSGSKLSYDNKFGITNRNIHITGEVFFEVAKNTKLPFLVYAGKVKIRAVGTAFNVKAYPEEGKVETTLVHGSVEIVKEGNKNPIYLKPSEKIIIPTDISIQSHTTKLPAEFQSKEEQSLSEKDADNMDIDKQIDIAKETSWMEGKLIFDREPLEKLAMELERKYDVHFSFENEKLKSFKYTGTFPDLPLEQIMDAMKFSSPISYRIKEKEVFLYEKN